MKYNGRTVTMNTFVFSKPVEKCEELKTWLSHFQKKGVFAFIHPRPDGKFVLVREGKERDTSMECEPIEGPCIHCGKKPPHPINHFRFCSDECMDAERRAMRKGK